MNDEGDSEKSDSDAVISNKASVSAGETNSEEKIVIATIKENEPRNKQDGSVEQKWISLTWRFSTPYPEEILWSKGIKPWLKQWSTM